MSPLTQAVRLEWEGKPAGGKRADGRLEVVRSGHPAAMLIQGDNLPALRALSKRCASSVTLAYLDPPFFTGRRHDRVVRTRDPRSGRVSRETTPAFDDRWSGFDAYLEAIASRLHATRDLLAPNGCLVLHVDPKTSHYAKILCDEVFGRDAFASEIVWRYRRWPSKTKNFQRVHDVLLRYVKDPSVDPCFTQLYEPLAPSTLRTWGDRKQRAIVDASGRRRRSSTTKDATPGTPMGDVWDIGIIAPVARERTGYPTQKPEALVERLVQACTAPGDLVLDPYLGSGTTLAVATRLGRRGIGIDESDESLRVARSRLRALGVRALEERVVTGRTRESRSVTRAS